MNWLGKINKLIAGKKRLRLDGEDHGKPSSLELGVLELDGEVAVADYGRYCKTLGIRFPSGHYSATGIMLELNDDAGKDERVCILILHSIHKLWTDVEFKKLKSLRLEADGPLSLDSGNLIFGSRKAVDWLSENVCTAFQKDLESKLAQNYSSTRSWVLECSGDSGHKDVILIDSGYGTTPVTAWAICNHSNICDYLVFDLSDISTDLE